MRLISTNGFWLDGTQIARVMSIKESIKALKDAGFDGYDLNIWHYFDDNTHDVNKVGHINFAKDLRAFTDDIGFSCVTAHGEPCGSRLYGFDIKNDTPKLIDTQTKCMEIAKIVGAESIVIHPVNDYSAEENFEYFYSKLIPISKQIGITILAENIFSIDKKNSIIYANGLGTPEKFNKLLDLAGGDILALVDVGHAELPNSPGAEAMLRGIGSRVKGLHVHDNAKLDDDHTSPFQSSCKMDWEKIIQALRDINYKGDFNFEATMMTKRYPKELYASALKHLCDIGRYFIDRITK